MAMQRIGLCIVLLICFVDCRQQGSNVIKVKEDNQPLPPPPAENECWPDDRYMDDKTACEFFTGVDVEPNYSFCGYNYKNYTKEEIDAVERVHVVFMTHFDLGYTDFQYCVVNRYLSVIFDEVMDTAEAMPSFIYTTEPWIAYIYLNCDRLKPYFKPPHPIEVICPAASALKRFITLANKGQITWHAFPWHGFNDMLDTSLYEFGFDFVTALNSDPRLYNVTKHRLTMAQVDVPGMGAAAIPIMTEKGVKAVYIGSNEGIGFVPDVERLFRWEVPVGTGGNASSSSVLMMLHPLGYGGLTTQDAFINPYTKEALLVSCCIDNTHGYTPTIVNNRLDVASKYFPMATVFPSSFDAFTKGLVPHADKFPVMKVDIGDMWNRAAASDPKKTAMFRAAMRERSKCIADRKCAGPLEDQNMLDFSQLILTASEHNWGVSPNNTWEKSTVSWIEKRDCMVSGLDILKWNSSYDPLVKSIEEEWAQLKPTKPDLNGMQRVTNPTTVTLSCSHYEIRVSQHGAIVYLKDTHSGRVWADPTHPIGWPTYYEYKTDGNYVVQQLRQPKGDLIAVWFSKETCKLFIEVELSQTVDNTLDESPDPATAGVKPFSMWLKYSFDVDEHDKNFQTQEEIRRRHKYIEAPCIGLTVQIFDKHIPVYWFGKGVVFSANIGFRPLLVNSDSWMLDIMSSYIPAVSTVKCGTQHYHNVWDGVHNQNITGGPGYFNVLTTDAPLMQFGYAGTNMFWNFTGADIPFDKPPNYADGFAYNLYNTMNFNWVSFYPWNNEDTQMQWRFQICLK